MNNNDYQLEEMENSAVNKSAMAKRAAAGAGLLAAGAATAYGAEHLMGGEDEPVVEPTTTEQPDLASGAAAGAVEEGVAEQPQAQPEPQTVHTEEDVHVYHHYVKDQEPQPEPEPEMKFESSTHLYDDEGNLVGTMDAGTYAGKDFLILDEDADGHGDVLWYDENGDGKIQQNELADVSGSGYAMGSRGGEHRDINIETGEVLDEQIAHNHVDPLEDIDNDFYAQEKSGEEYRDDLAQNNPDYNPNGENVDQYRAGGESASEEPVLEEEPMLEEDHHEAFGDYNVAEDDTLLEEEDSTEEYALSEEEPSDDTTSEDMAYEDGDEIENDIDDTAEEDLAYNDEDSSDVDDNIDDTDQYDIV